MRRPGRRPGTESAWDGGDDLQASQCSWGWWSWRKPRIENDPANRRRFAILVPPPRRQPWHVRARPNRPCTRSYAGSDQTWRRWMARERDDVVKTIGLT